MGSHRIAVSIIFFFTLQIILSGCFAVRPFTGSNVDIDQLTKAREAKVMEVRLAGAQRLSDRLRSNDPVDNADMTFFFSEALLNKTAAQLDSTTGWLDSLTSYSIRTIRVKLYNGSAIATIKMAAFHHQHDVDVDLLMDCLLMFSVDSGKFYARLEPFNVVPTVKASGFISSMEGIISDILSIKLSTLSDYLPPLQFPVDFDNQFPVQENLIKVRNGINMDIRTPPHLLYYSLTLKEALIVSGQLIVSFNLRKVGVEK